MSPILYFLPLFNAQAGRFVLTLTLSVVTLAAGAALLGTSGWFITAAALSTAGVSFNIFGPSALVRGFSFIRILARYGERLVGHNATLKLLSDIRAWLFARLFPLAPLTVSGIRHGDLVSRLIADVEALDTLFLVSVAPVLTAVIIGGGVAAVLWSFLPAAAGIYGIALLLAVIGVPAIYLPLSRRPSTAVGIASAALRTATLDGIEGHRDLVAAGATEWAAERLAAAAEQSSRARRALGDTVGFASATVQLLAATAMLGVLWFGLEAVHDDRLSGPVLVGLLLAVIGSFEATAVLVRSVGKFGVAVVAARRLHAMTVQEPLIGDPLVPVPLPAGTSIEFNHVSFGYAPDRLVLDDLSLRIGAGSRVALIGPSGSGKSTILALLLRLQDPPAGSVTIAGADLRTVRQVAVHQRAAFLAQDTPVFMDTIRNNLLIGHSDATDAALWQALAAARLADFVRAMPAGLDSFVGEAGRTLSAGQARRLCLARTLLSGAGIIVLDEPTSGLDSETEEAFLTDLAEATAGRTVIIATHATLPAGAVDAIYRLENGRLAVAPFDAGQGALPPGLLC